MAGQKLGGGRPGVTGGDGFYDRGPGFGPLGLYVPGELIEIGPTGEIFTRPEDYITGKYG